MFYSPASTQHYFAMLMSDDGSFVILGTTPTASMNGYIDKMDATPMPPTRTDVSLTSESPINGSHQQVPTSADLCTTAVDCGSPTQPFSILTVDGGDTSGPQSGNQPNAVPLLDALSDAMLESGGSPRSVVSFRIPEYTSEQLRDKDNYDLLQVGRLQW